jgi:hypothetical protein
VRFPGDRDSQILRQSAYEDGKVVSPTHRPPIPPQEIFLLLISVRGWVDPSAIVRPEGLCQRRIPVTPSGIEPATLSSHTYRYTNSVLFMSSFYVAYLKQQIGLNLKEKLLKCYIWSINLYGAWNLETSEVQQKYLESFEKRCWEEWRRSFGPMVSKLRGIT